MANICHVPCFRSLSPWSFNWLDSSILSQKKEGFGCSPSALPCQIPLIDTLAQELLTCWQCFVMKYQSARCIDAVMPQDAKTPLVNSDVLRAPLLEQLPRLGERMPQLIALSLLNRSRTSTL
jgi:hypothetical protein